MEGKRRELDGKGREESQHKEHRDGGGEYRSQEILIGECPYAGLHGVQDGKPDDGDEHEQTADLREEEELHGGLVPVLVAPDVDEEIHRHEHELPEEGE